MSHSKYFILRIQNWRATLIAVLIGVLVMQAIAMKWLVEFQVETARENRFREAKAREAHERCADLGSHKAIDACRMTNAMRGNLTK
jgi:hypothetical protein